MVAAATLITAGASIISGLIGSKANKDASEAASASNAASIAEAKRQFDLIRSDTAPYRQAGGQSIDFLRRLLLGNTGGGGDNSSQISQLQSELAGLRYHIPGKVERKGRRMGGGRSGQNNPVSITRTPGRSGYTNPARAAQIESQIAALRRAPTGGGGAIDPNALDWEAISPGYNFRRLEGEKGIARAQSSRKDRFSGRQMKELLRYGQDYASSEFAPFVDRLFRLGGYGSSAVGTSAYAGLNTASQIAAANARTGNAQAAGTIGAAQSWNNAIQGGLSNYMFNEYLNKPISAGGYTSLGGGRV